MSMSIYVTKNLTLNRSIIPFIANNKIILNVPINLTSIPSFLILYAVLNFYLIESHGIHYSSSLLL